MTNKHKIWKNSPSFISNCWSC